jgi:hypothetical protein
MTPLAASLVPATTPKAPRPKLTTAQIAIRRGKRAGGELHKLATERGHAVTGKVEACGGTAAWTFTAKPKAMHTILLDPDFTALMDAPRRKTKGIALAYAQAMLRHERWHGLVTDPDLKALNGYAMTCGVTFDAFNIGEDLRLEARARAKEGVVFNWLMYNKLPPHHALMAVTEPLLWLSLVTMWELPDSAAHGVSAYGVTHMTWGGDAMVERARTLRGVLVSKDGVKDTAWVLSEFVREIRAAATSYKVIDVLADMFATFPHAKGKASDIPNLHGRHGGSFSKSGGDDGERATEAPERGYTAVTAPAVERNERSLNHFVRGPLADARKPLPAGHRWEEGEQMQTRAAGRMAERMATLFGSVDSPRMRTATSGSRLHMSGVMVGDSAAFRRSSSRGGKRKCVFIFDQSGSMNYSWNEHGAAFCSAVLQLHQQGVIDATIIMTGGGRSAILPTSEPKCVPFRMRCNEGSESLRDTLQTHADKVAAADSVIVYTDGQLTDGAVNAGEWRARGVDLIGAMVCDNGGTSYYRGQMDMHFGNSILRESGLELATALVQHIGATTK